MSSSDSTSSSRWWSFPRVLWLSVGVALALGLLSLQSGFMPDDYIPMGVLNGVHQPAPIGPTTFDMYRIATGDPAATESLSQLGVFPWWVLPELRVSFWRPLSSAMVGVDHALFGANPKGYLVHSALWYAAVVALAGLLLRRVLPGAVGALAVLFFALDESHAAIVSWISQRATMVSLFFALAAVWLHVDRREKGRAWSGPLSLLALALGLAAGETTLMALPYFFAYEWLSGPGKRSERLRALVPMSVLLLAYGAAHYGLGYGATGSGMYLDPLPQPLYWLQEMLVRVPAALGGLLLNTPVDYMDGGAYTGRLVAAGLVALVVGGLLLRAAWPGLDEPDRRHVRWLLAGAFGATWLSSSTMPSSRTLMVPSVGAAVAIAVLVNHAWRQRQRARGGKALLAGAVVLVLLHGAYPLYAWWFTSNFLGKVAGALDRVQKRYEAAVDPAHFPEQRLVLLNVPDAAVGIYASVQWWAQGKPLPRAWWTLSYSPHEYSVTRTGPATLELAQTQGEFLTMPAEFIHRDRHHPLTLGQEIDVKGMKVKVLEMGEQGPKRLSFTFDVPLEDPSLVLLHWKDKKPQRYVPPPLGSPGLVFNARVTP